MESGRIGLSVDDIALMSLADSEATRPAPPTLRVDAELVEYHGSTPLRWNGTSSCSISGNVVASKESAAPEGQLSDSFSAHLAFSAYTASIALEKKSLCAICDCFVRITVASVTSAAPPAVKSGKPQQESGATSTSEPLLEIDIPLRLLVVSFGCRMSSSDVFGSYGSSEVTCRLLNTQFDSSMSYISWTITGDDSLAEHCLGAALFRVEGAEVLGPHRLWTPVIPEVPEPKSKGQPIEAVKAAHRQKLIDAACKAASTASEAYSLRLGGEASDAKFREYLGESVLPPPKTTFDVASAGQIPLGDDIRTINSLWSLSWGPAAPTFLHRRELKRLSFALFSGHVTLPVVLEKKASSGVATDHPIKAAGSLDMSAFAVPGTLNAVAHTQLVPVVPSEAEATLEIRFQLSFTSSPTPPATLKPSLDPGSVASTTSGRQVAAAIQEVDVLQELRDEMAVVVRTVAREYVTLYPLPSTHGPAESASEEGFSLSARKADFFHFLSSSAKYHALKEGLKPKVQRVVRHRFGVRGRAMGYGADALVPPEGINSKESVPLDSLLQDMYVFLLKECNLVLNDIFRTTLIDRDASELERGARIDDTEETPSQAFTRLGDLAADAEADGRFEAAEQIHLERIALVSGSAALGIDKDKAYASFALYAEFLLRQAVQYMVRGQNDLARERTNLARETLEVAASKSNRRRYWRYELLLACLLLETGANEAGDIAMGRSLAAQLDIDRNTFSVDSIGGYDSEELCRADPLVYAVLAGQFLRRGEKLSTRKALRLVSMSYSEGNFTPFVSMHGTPRRTAVLCLSRAAEYLFGFGFSALGNSCLTLAQECDEAAASKALENGVPSAAPTFIRYALKRAQAAQLLCQGDVDGAVELFELSQSVTEDVDDQIRSLLWKGKLHADYPQDDQAVASAVDTFVSAINLASGRLYAIPLDAFIRLGKLLIAGGRYVEAREYLICGCRVYSFSSALFRLTGIASLRLSALEDAEEALYEANLLDNRNPDVWGYLCILCLAGGPSRLGEAECALRQAFRLNLDSVDILRELAVAYMEADRLTVAEDLIRRASALERYLWNLLLHLQLISSAEMLEGVYLPGLVSFLLISSLDRITSRALSRSTA